MRLSFSSFYKAPRLTLFGRSLLLIITELIANAICWIIAGILFGRHHDTQPILSLALLAWVSLEHSLNPINFSFEVVTTTRITRQTIGLRHALDADHISAIDNATRGLIDKGQLSVTCGLFFSLGHSTIVIVVNVAIAISTDIYDKINGVGTIGAIVGSAVSGSFLFIVGLANSIILYGILKRRHQAKKKQAQLARDGEASLDNNDDLDDDGRHNHMLMLRILGPVITFVDRPWKMYPVGVLFGFGFDTASSIALLAVSAIAKRGSDGKTIPVGYVVILPFLFTAGMTLIDSLDSILMLYSYSGFPEHSLAVFERVPPSVKQDAHAHRSPECKPEGDIITKLGLSVAVDRTATPLIQECSRDEHCRSAAGASDGTKTIETDVQIADARVRRDLRVKQNTMSGLSIILTLMSILVAFSISLITIMGLIGDNCSRCQEAAGAEDGGGVAGSWWRGWAKANDISGFIGAAIVGAFISIVCMWYGGRWTFRKVKARQSRYLRSRTSER